MEARRMTYIGALLPPDPDEGAPQGGQPGWIARGYAYDPAHPHAVSGLTVSGEQTAAYEYDQNGNLTCRLEDGLTYKQTYNAENRISGIHKMDGGCQNGTSIESWLYTYDGDGVRMGEYYFVGLTLTLEKTYLFGGAYEYQSDDVVRKYYAIAGQVIAVRTVTATESTLSYFLTDHLGSTSAILDETGTLINQQRYLPFGAVRSDLQGSGFGITQTDRTYTGQRDLTGTGLMDYKARFYSPHLSRFIQPDTLIPGAGDPQAWNRYSYVLNSPVRYNDPSGHYQCDTCTGWYHKRGEELIKPVGPGRFGDVYNAAMVTYIAAGINVQRVGIDPPVPMSEYPNSSYGPSQLTWNQLNTDLGKGFGCDEKGRNCDGYGLGLFGQNPQNDATAVEGMRRRIALVVGMCGHNGLKCDETDMFIISAMAQNGPGFDQNDMKDVAAFAPGGVIDWERYFNLRQTQANAERKFWFLSGTEQYDTRYMLRVFYNEVECLAPKGYYIPPSLDHRRIQNLANGTYSDAVRAWGVPMP